MIEEEHDQEKAEITLVEKDESVLSGWEEAAQDIPKPANINLERDFLIAKSYLQNIGCRNETIWDHLNDILNHVLKERPKDCMRYFEELSREIRIRKFFITSDCEGAFKDLDDKPTGADEAKRLLRFYRKVECLYESENPYEDKFGSYDFRPFFRLLIEAGVGPPYTDTYHIQMGMKLIAKTFPVSTLTFWGKVLGTVRDYFVVEGELTPEAMAQRFKDFTKITVASVDLIPEVEAESEGLPEMENEEFSKVYFGEEASVIVEVKKRKLDLYVSPPLPVLQVKEKVVVPVEPPGHGTNRKVYFVANDPTEDWTMLPDVTPEQIVTSRIIHKYVTGILSNPVNSFPKFPGTEQELLRALIARITAGTHVSPLGFYSAGGEEEAVEVEEGQLYTENVDYQPFPIRDLLDPTLEFWVHHEPYILNQGRTEFWAPDATGEEVEEEGGINQTKREEGPNILSSLSPDVMKPDGSPAWNVRRASTLLDEDSAVILRSNVWPGALTAVKERLFVNFYVGWGTKAHLKGFSPPFVFNIQPEYELGPEIMEMQDPTVEMEEYRWLQLHPKIIRPSGEEGGEGDDDDVDEKIET